MILTENAKTNKKERLRNSHSHPLPCPHPLLSSHLWNPRKTIQPFPICLLVRSTRFALLVCFEQTALINRHNYFLFHFLLFQIKLQILNIWLTFAVSLTIFPAMQVDVVATHNSSSVLWGLYFTPVTCFLLFNLLDFLGSIVPAWIKWVKTL